MTLSHSRLDIESRDFNYVTKLRRKLFSFTMASEQAKVVRLTTDALIPVGHKFTHTHGVFVSYRIRIVQRTHSANSGVATPGPGRSYALPPKK